VGKLIDVLLGYLKGFFAGVVVRPWGKFINLAVARVKILQIDPRQALSLQYHHKRSELWVVLSGKPYISVGQVATEYNPGSVIFIPAKETHQALAPDETVHILELSFGEFEETDIVRLQDPYNREKENT
jgi:mannose-6-phosphate isomerase